MAIYGRIAAGAFALMVVGCSNGTSPGGDSAGTDATATDTTTSDIVSDTPLADTAHDARDAADVARSGCRGATDCATCTMMAGTATQGCGWCANQGVCLDGTMTGSSDGSCTGASWGWAPAACPGYCAMQQADCDTCTNAGCGWCGGTNTCMAGDSTGTMSADGTCTGSNWLPIPQTCPDAVAQCASLSDTCNDCTTGTTNFDYCGWCPAAGTCLPGTAMGPLTGVTQSSCAGWSWLPADCTADGGTPDAGAPDVVSTGDSAADAPPAPDSGVPDDAAAPTDAGVPGDAGAPSDS